MSNTHENARVEAFSDGVFAIAITLLVLEIKVPPLDSIHSVADLWHEIAKLGPSYFAFVLSFGFILIGGVNHHLTFNLIDKTSPAFIYANGFLLFSFVFLPFPTAMLAEYLTTDFAQPAIVFYCFSYVLQNIGWNLVYESIFKPKVLIKEGVPVSRVKAVLKNCRYGLAIYSFTTLVSWWFPLTALTINTLLWFLWLKMSMVSSDKKE